MKLVEIASQLSIPEGTVRRWKCTHKSTNVRIKKRTFGKEKRKKIVKEKAIADEVNQVLENTDLTDKQKLFRLYYIRYFNATKAYKKAYGCSYDVANSEGYNSL